MIENREIVSMFYMMWYTPQSFWSEINAHGLQGGKREVDFMASRFGLERENRKMV